MANRTTSILLKSSGVVGKIPSISDLSLGELAINFADAKLYSRYTGGSGFTEVRQVGWDKLSLTGGTLSGNITANSFIKSGGTSNQFLKADGSVDTSVYSIDSGVVHISGSETITGSKTFSGGLTSNSLTLSNLNGTGKRFVTADATGVLSATPQVGVDVPIRIKPGDIYASGIQNGLINNYYRNYCLQMNMRNDFLYETSTDGVTFTDSTSTLTDTQIENVFMGNSIWSTSINLTLNNYARYTFPSTDPAVGTLSGVLAMFGYGQYDMLIERYTNDTTPVWETVISISNSVIYGHYALPNTVYFTTAQGNQYCSKLRITFKCTVQGNYGLNSLFPYYLSGGGINLQNYKITRDGYSQFPSTVKATSFVKSGGTSSQFLKADGSVDSNVYINATGTYSDPTWLTNLSYSKVSGLTLGSIPFSNGTGLTQNNSNLFWNNTNNILGVGTNTPSDPPYGRGIGHFYKNTGSQTTLIIENSGSVSYLGAELLLRTDSSTRGKGITMYSTDSTKAWGIGVPYSNPDAFEIGFLADYTANSFKQSGTLANLSESLLKLTSSGNLILSGNLSVGGTTTSTGNVTAPNLLYTTGNQTINGVDTFASLPNFTLSSTSSAENGLYNPIYTAIAAGTPLYFDEEFASGYNSVGVYNNLGSSGLTLTRIADTHTPNRSGYKLSFNYTAGGATSPGLGGFYQSVTVAANRTYVQRFRAKLPVGYSFVVAANSLGTGANDYFMNSSSGTGKWEEYIRVIKAGYTGTFSTAGYVYVNGSTSSGFTWDLASCNIYEVDSSYSSNLEQVLRVGNTSTMGMTLGGNLTFSGTSGLGVHINAYAFYVVEYPKAGIYFDYPTQSVEFRDGGGTIWGNISLWNSSPGWILSKMGFGTTTPTARVHIAAGSATANSAPLKFTSGALLTTPETGAIEYDGTHIYATIGTNRYQIDQQTTGLYSASNFVSKEIPTGTIDGVNATFNLSYTPIVGTEHVYINGLLMDENSDYSISGSTITFLSGAIPEINDKLRVSYHK